jgi:hypothetical protein
MNTVKNIKISDKLRTVLLNFSDNSAVSRLLLQNEITETQLCTKNIDFLCISSEDFNKISYLTKDRLSSISEADIWTSPKRYHQKPGSLISKIFKNISSKEIENFSNLFRAFSNKKDFTFDIVKGGDIKWFYYEDSYSRMSGSLGNSCMRYSKCGKYFNLYLYNPNAELLVMKGNDGQLLGRTLLWKCGDYKIMDRIYTINDEEYQFYFTHWANKMGYLHKKRQTWGSTLQFVKLGQDIELKLEIQLQKWDFEYFPYVDTFKWIDLEKGLIFNYRPDYFSNRNRYHCILTSSEGSLNNPESLEFDSISKDWHHQGTLMYIEYCDILTQSQHVVYSETLDQNILKKDATWSEELEDYIFTDLERNNKELIFARKTMILKRSLRQKGPDFDIEAISKILNIDQELIHNYISQLN